LIRLNLAWRLRNSLTGTWFRFRFFSRLRLRKSLRALLPGRWQRLLSWGRQRFISLGLARFFWNWLVWLLLGLWLFCCRWSNLRLLPAGRLQFLGLASLTPLFYLLLAQNRPVYFAAAWNVFRNRGRAHDFSYRFGGDRFTRRHADFGNAGPDIYNNLPVPAADPPRLMAKVDTHHPSAVDNPCVVNEHYRWTYRAAETTNVHEDKQRRAQNDAARSKRTPPDIIGRLSPTHPCWRPFGARNPDPTEDRVVHPCAIMVSCPGPGFITDPVPSELCPFPTSVRVRAPCNGNVCRVPAAPIRAKGDPRAKRCKRPSKIRRGIDSNARRKGDLGFPTGSARPQ
jgi:hypothetical protein